jgi:hypothetical protein
MNFCLVFSSQGHRGTAVRRQGTRGCIRSGIRPPGSCKWPPDGTTAGHIRPHPGTGWSRGGARSPGGSRSGRSRPSSSSSRVYSFLKSEYKPIIPMQLLVALTKSGMVGQKQFTNRPQKYSACRHSSMSTQPPLAASPVNPAWHWHSKPPMVLEQTVFCWGQAVVSPNSAHSSTSDLCLQYLGCYCDLRMEEPRQPPWPATKPALQTH